MNAFVSLVCVQVLLGGPEYSVRCAKYIRRLLALIGKLVVSLMPRDSLQVAALGHEIANLKGKLPILLNSERVWHEQARQKENIITGVPRIPCINSTTLNYSPFQFQIGVVFLAGIAVGCVISISSVCLGVWIRYIL